MYITQTDLVKFQIENNNNITVGEMLKELVLADADTDEKKDMEEGDNYYRAKHDILDHDFRVYYLDKIKHINERKSNNLIVHPYHGLLVDQKANYTVGKPISITGEDEKFVEIINNLLGKRFNDVMNTLMVNSSNRGVEYLHPYINRKGKFDFVSINAREVIPVYDTQFQKELVGVIRYYQVEVKETASSPTQLRYRVEVWDSEKVTFFAEDSSGEFILDPDKEVNPQPHWFIYNTAFPGKMEGKGWGRVPFVEFKNNELKTTDLALTKKLIDDYDFQVSDMSNKLVDIARFVWVLKGYQGQDLAEFVKNLESFGAIKVRSDGAVENKSSDIPSDAHNSHLDRLEDNIYIFGRGVNMRSDKFGNSPSGVALKFMYALLDLKSNTTIGKFSLALENFAYFPAKYAEEAIKPGNYDFESLEFTFNKSMILNEKEMVEMASESKGIISDETIIANHPWVKNPQEETQRLKEQQKANSIDLDGLNE